MVTRRHLTYFTWLGDELISVQNFPAWVCDLCGRREYDHHAVMTLNMLLNPDAGKPALRHIRTTRSVKKNQPQLREIKP